MLITDPVLSRRFEKMYLLHSTGSSIHPTLRKENITAKRKKKRVGSEWYRMRYNDLIPYGWLLSPVISYELVF